MVKDKNNDNLDKQLELALANLDRQFGRGSVIRLDDDPQPWPSITTRSISLDRALGIGGWPLGRIVEVFGQESSGKSTLCMSVIAEAQAQGKKCLYVDTEHSIDPLYAKSLGVNLSTLLVSQPDTGEEALNIVETMVRTGAIGVVVVDSVAALTPKAELEGSMDDNHVGRQARMMSMAMRKLRGVVSDTKTLLIFTNQLREKVGVMFGNPIVQPGGRALKFYSSVRVELSVIEKLKDKDGYIAGVRVRAKVIKNKVAPPFRMAEYEIVYGRGIDLIGEVVDLGVETGILKKSGTWYSYKDQQLGQGRPNTIQLLGSDLDLFEQIKKEILQ